MQHEASVIRQQAMRDAEAVVKHARAAAACQHGRCELCELAPTTTPTTSGDTGTGLGGARAAATFGGSGAAMAAVVRSRALLGHEHGRQRVQMPPPASLPPPVGVGVAGRVAGGAAASATPTGEPPGARRKDGDGPSAVARLLSPRSSLESRRVQNI